MERVAITRQSVCDAADLLAAAARAAGARRGRFIALRARLSDGAPAGRRRPCGAPARQSARIRVLSLLCS
jgi:hypothetical protein